MRLRACAIVMVLTSLGCAEGMLPEAGPRADGGGTRDAGSGVDASLGDAGPPPTDGGGDSGADADRDAGTDAGVDAGCLGSGCGELVDEGWFVPTPSGDTQVVYVSTTDCDDTTAAPTLASSVADPFHPPSGSIHAYCDLSRAITALRTGYPDWLLFRRGERFDHPIGVAPAVGQLGNHGFDRSGRSATEPLVLAGYGDGAMPIVTTGPTGHVLSIWNQRHIRILGLDFYRVTRDPDSPEFDLTSPAGMPFRIQYACEDILLEGNRFRFFGGGVIQRADGDVGPVDIRVVRNVFLDSWTCEAEGSRPQGLYGALVDRLLIRENVFDHNGWSEHPTLTAMGEACIVGRNAHNHNVYLTSSTRTVIERNFFLRGSSMGLKLRSDIHHGHDDLRVEDNVFVRNAIGVSLGGLDTPGGFNYRNYVIRGNLVTETGVTSSRPFGPTNWGVTVITGEHGVIEGNLLVHNPSPVNPLALSIGPGPHVDVVVRDNVVHGYAGFAGIQASATDGVTLSENLVETATASPAFVDSTRTLSTYFEDVVGETGGTDGMITLLRAQRPGAWRRALTAGPVLEYMRGGFRVP